MQLSPHFSLHELTKSDYATRHGIDNNPSQDILDELKQLSVMLLETVRLVVGNKPIIITSGYRCPELNLGIGGSRTSQHMGGQAADFEVLGLGNRNVIDLIHFSPMIVFDQLIYEFGEEGWIHISRSKNPRREILMAERGVDGKTKYSLHA